MNLAVLLIVAVLLCLPWHAAMWFAWDWLASHGWLPAISMPVFLAAASGAAVLTLLIVQNHATD
jgi:hypothetical protein